mmetsp:Transcript_47860/g.137297  ORF Transcript_47860/g.137297 Transcript_47860/m.137297 type:complete len:125 (+) Transcript_47860:139-513(+)
MSPTSSRKKQSQSQSQSQLSLSMPSSAVQQPQESQTEAELTQQRQQHRLQLREKQRVLQLQMQAEQLQLATPFDGLAFSKGVEGSADAAIPATIRSWVQRSSGGSCHAGSKVSPSGVSKRKSLA